MVPKVGDVVVLTAGELSQSCRVLGVVRVLRPFDTEHAARWVRERDHTELTDEWFAWLVAEKYVEVLPYPQMHMEGA